MTTITAFALKRSIIARLMMVNNGTITPTPVGTEALTGVDVQVGTVLPADPDRLCVYGTPVRSTRTQTSAEQVTTTETVSCEIRIRVYQPGQADEDVSAVDLLTGQLANAVAVAVLDVQPYIVDRTLGNLSLTDVVQWPTAITPNPEPSAMGLASLTFTAELVTN